MLIVKVKGCKEEFVNGVYRYAGSAAVGKDIECLLNTFAQLECLEDVKITVRFIGDNDGDNVQSVD